MAGTAQWLTQDAYDKLKAELEDLSTRGRREIAKTIEAARAEGDLSENGGYHAAKDDQGKMESRISWIQHTLLHAEIVEVAADSDVVGPGMVVQVTYAGDDEVETFMLGSRELNALDDAVDVEVYSPQSPLGQAIIGKRAGDTASYQTPTGRTITVTIVSATPFIAGQRN